MTYSTRKIPQHNKTHNARMKRFVSYTVLAALVWGNVAQAGKDFMDARTEDTPLIRIVKPIRHSTTKEVDHLFFHVDTQSIEVSGTDGGQARSISKVNIARPIREAMSHSTDALDAFLKINTFSVKEIDGDLILHVHGTLKGGMFGGGSGFSGSSFRGSGNFRGGGINWDFRTPSGGGGIIVYPNSTTRELGIGQGGTYGNTTSSMPPIKHPPISGHSNLGPSQRAPLKSRGPIPDKEEKPKTLTKPKEDTQKLKKDFGPIYGEYDHSEILKHKINTSTWDDANTYAKEYGFSKEQYGYIKDHRTGFTFASYMKATNGFYQEYDLAQQVRTLINTKSWDDVYKFSDQMGVSRENVAYINQNRGMLDFKDYMLKTNVTYASFNHATTIQRLINTDTWDNVYAYAEKHSITKQQVKEIDKRRTENLSTTQMTKNIKGEVAYDDPLMPNGLVYPVKQTNDMEADAFLPAGYKVSLQDQTLGEALLRGFGKGVDKLLCATIGPCYQAHASYGRLAMEIAKNGPAMVNMADKSWKWTAVTLGLGAKTLYEKDALDKGFAPHVKTLKDMVLNTPVQDTLDAKLKILETWGIEQGVKILKTPESEKLAIKLVTGTYEGPKANILNKEMPFAKDQLPHIFKDKPGHMKEDTPESRAKLFDAVEPKNLIRTDEWGKQRYASTTSDGKQTWVHVRNGEIMNGGVNENPIAPGDV